jgi:hypothetical protein
MLRKIFTKRFFELSESDQAAVVRSIMQELEDCVGRHIDPADDKKAEQRIKRVRARAAQYGVLQDEPKAACFAKLVTHGGDQ